jgi:alkanesulfonate monooxygenase
MQMSLSFHWFLPTNGDSRSIGGGNGRPAGAANASRPATLSYLTQLARAAEDLGFTGALTPTGEWCEDAWLSTAMLVENTRRLKFLVAFRPGLLSPTLAAQMAATYQWHSGGRLLLNVVTGGEPHEQRGYGDFLDKAARYQRCGEFLHIVRSLWAGETVSFTGRHLQVEGARLPRLPRPVLVTGIGGAGELAVGVPYTTEVWPARRRLGGNKRGGSERGGSRPAGCADGPRRSSATGGCAGGLSSPR